MITWVKEWPIEPGYYWFHGVISTSSSKPKKTYLAKVCQGYNSILHMTEDSFLFEGEAEGVWTPAIVPTPEN